jgi:hypothetical protein
MRKGHPFLDLIPVITTTFPSRGTLSTLPPKLAQHPR